MDKLVSEDNTRKTSFVLTTFRIPEEIHKQLKIIAARENRDMASIVNEGIQKYVKVHGDGNPAYTLDQFKDPEFRAYPAFMTKIENWSSYLARCKKEEIQEIRDKANAIYRLIDKRFPI